MKSTIIAIVGALLFLFAGAVEVSGATTYTWTGASSTAWATTTNWSPNGNPGSATNDVVIIPATSNKPTLATTPTNSLASLTFTGASTLTINSGRTITVSGAVTNNAAATGTIVGTGTLSCGSVSVGNGATLDFNTVILNVSGTTTVGGGASGTLAFSNATGAKTFTGLVTINSGATWSETAAAIPTFKGGITNSGTFTASTGVHTFNTNAQALSGTISIPSVTITGVTVTNNGTLTCSTTLSGTGGLTNALTRTLNIGGTCSIGTLTNVGTIGVTGSGAISTAAANLTNTGTINLNGSGNITGITNNGGGIVNLTNSGTITSFNNATSTSTLNIDDLTVPTITTLTTSAVGNTVNYNGAGAQTAKVNAYSNLTLSGSGIKTFATTPTVNRVLSIEGTATVVVTGVGVVTYGGSATLQYKTTDIRTASAEEWLATFAATGGVIIANTAGSVTMDVAKVFNSGVPLTINTGATLITNNLQLTFGGNFSNSGTLTAGSSPVIITTTATTQTIDGFTTTGDVSMTKTAGTATLQGNVNGGSLTINGAGGTLSLGGGTHTFTGTWTRTAGTLDGGTGLLRIGGSVSGTGGTFTANAGTVEWYASGAQTVAGVTYNNLTLSGTSAKTTTGVTVNGILSMEGNGTVSSSAAITYGAAATLQYKGSAAQTTTNFEFPVTFSGTGGLIVNNSSGVTLNNAKTVTSIELILGILNTGGNILTVTNTATTAVSGGSTTTFIDGPLKWTLPASLASGSTYQFPVGDGTTYLPFSLVNPTTSGSATAQIETFATGSGGSAGTGISAISTSEYWKLTTAGSFTNSSVSITRPSAITPSTVVATNTTSAGSAYSNFGGAYDTNGVYNSNTTSTVGAQYFVFGTGTTPSLNVDKTVLYGFNYSLSYGPSTEQSFKVSGVGLTADIIVTPSNANFEISTVSGGIFQTSAITIAKTGSAANATIYVRLKSGAALGNYSSALTISTTGLSNKTVNLYGSVSPTITASGGGSYCTGSTITLGSTGGTNRYWTGPNSFYSLVQNPTVTTSATTAMSGTYTVTGSSPSGVNLVTNGDFESGNSSITTAYFYAGTGSTALSSGGTHGNTGGEGNYTVVQDPNTVHSSFSSCSPHGGTKQMVINGSSYIETVWGQTITGITPYSDYQFVYYLQTVCATFPSQLQLYVNGVAAGIVYDADPTVCVQKQFIYNWNSGSSTTAILELKNMQTATGGNDFAIDDISFEQVYTSTASVDVTVLAASAPASVSVTASANPVNAGTSVTYTATPTNGGTSPTYQWSVNGVNVSGATGTTYSYMPANGDVVKCTMTSNSACLTLPNPVNSSVTMVVNPAVKNYWVGTNSTDWGTASNWSAGYVPGDNDEVEFSTIANNSLNAKRNLVLDVDRRVSRLINQSALPIRQLIIPAARGLTVSDTIKIPATYPDSSRIYIQTDATGSQQNGTLIFHNIGKVYATVEMYARGSYDATGTSYGGNTYHYTWQYFGIPVATASANPTFYGSYVRSWYEPGTNMTNHWKYLTNDSILQPFWGYELTQQSPKVIVFQGQLINSDWTSTILATTPAAAFPGQYIFANPYTAALNMQDFITTNLPYDTDGSVYLYSTGSYANWGNNGTGSTDGTSPGQYQVCTMAGGGATQISSMQALLMQTTSSLQPTTKVVFHYSDVEKNAILQRSKRLVNRQSASLLTNIKIDVAGAHYNDRLWLFSDSTFTSSYDKGWDGRKLFGIAFAPQLFAIEEDGPYQISCKKSIHNTIIGFQRGLDTDYTFTFTNSNTDKDYKNIYLIDSVANKIVDITRSGTQYSFVVDSVGTYNNRFKIIASSNESNLNQNKQLKIFNASGKFYVDNKSSEKGEFTLYDLAGRAVINAPFSAHSVTEVGSLKQKGIYIGRASISIEKETERFILSKK